MTLTDDYYKQSEWGRNYASRMGNSWRYEIDYNRNGKVINEDLPDDVGNNHFEIQVILNKLHSHELRNGIRPQVSLVKVNRALEYVETAVAVSGPALAVGTLGSAVAAGFLDRYRLTLAARIDGIRGAIGVLSDLTKPCIEKLPNAIQKMQEAGQLVTQYQAVAEEMLPLARGALQDAETAKKGLEVCANLVGEFSKIVEPMERVNEAMAGQGLATKMKEFIYNLDMATAREAWNTYSLGEQSLGYLLDAVTVVGVGLAVRSGTISVCTNVLHLSESKAKLVGNIAGIGAGVFVKMQGGLLESASTCLGAVTKIILRK